MFILRLATEVYSLNDVFYLGDKEVNQINLSEAAKEKLELVDVLLAPDTGYGY